MSINIADSLYQYKLYRLPKSAQKDRPDYFDFDYRSVNLDAHQHTIRDALYHVPVETDSIVARHALHNEALQKLANQLPIIKIRTATRIHRIDLLFVDLCLMSKLITQDLKQEYVSAFLHIYARCRPHY